MKSTMEFVKTFDGLKLRLRRDIIEGAKAVVVISHGRGARIETAQYVYITEELHKAGYSTYIYDQRGHGESEGPRAYYSDFREIAFDVNAIIEIVKAENPEKKIFLFGNSMGCFAAEVFGCLYPGKADGFILSVFATAGSREIPERPENPMEVIVLSKTVSIGELEQTDNYSVTTPGLDYAIQKGKNWLADNYKRFSDPVLIVNAELDRPGSMDEAFEFFKGIKVSDKMLKIYGGAEHKLYGGPVGPQVMADTLAWLEARA